MLTSYTVFQKICDLRTQKKITIKKYNSLTKELLAVDKIMTKGLEQLMNRLEKIK